MRAWDILPKELPKKLSKMGIIYMRLTGADAEMATTDMDIGLLALPDSPCKGH